MLHFINVEHLFDWMILQQIKYIHCKPKKAYQALYVWIGKVHRRYRAWLAEFIWLGNFGWEIFVAGQAQFLAWQAFLMVYLA